jgi:hypothetical protein
MVVSKSDINLEQYTRCWIFPSEQPLVGWEKQVQKPVEEFLSKWKNERNPLVQGGWDVLHNHFIVFYADETAFPLSGCSIDSMHRFVSSLGQQYNIELPSRKLFYQDENGNVLTATRPEFRMLVKEGVITSSTMVFDTTITKPQFFIEGLFVLPAEKSWHKALL